MGTRCGCKGNCDRCFAYLLESLQSVYAERVTARGSSVQICSIGECCDTSVIDMEKTHKLQDIPPSIDTRCLGRATSRTVGLSFRSTLRLRGTKSNRTLLRQEVSTQVFPFDLAWDVDNQTLASNIFATSIVPYAGFLYHLQKSKKAPRLMLFGFRFLLVFVLATIIAGIYAKLHYNSILANVDWLHGSAESFLTLTNLFIVLGLREGIKDAQSLSNAKEVDKATALKEESEALK